MAFTDYIDLRTAVIEEVGDADIVDVFDRLTKLAEAKFNHTLRTHRQITETTLTFTDNAAAIPADLAEIIGLYDGYGREYVQRPHQESKLTYPVHTFSTAASTIYGPSGDLRLDYYAKIPTLTTSMTASNWLLENYPSVYLYGVSLEAAKHMRDIEQASAIKTMMDMEMAELMSDDADRRYARVRVRVQGNTP